MFERVVMDGAVSASSGDCSVILGFFIFILGIIACSFFEVVHQEEKEAMQNKEETQM